MKTRKKIFRRTVDKELDGDTFRVKRKVNGSNYVRLSNIDTPEKGKKGYSKAKSALGRMVAGKKVTITPVGRSYGRVVAKTTVNRKNVNKHMKRYRKK